MSVAPPVRFPMARRSERLDPYETLDRYHGLMKKTQADDEK